QTGLRRAVTSTPTGGRCDVVFALVDGVCARPWSAADRTWAPLQGADSGPWSDAGFAVAAPCRPDTPHGIWPGVAGPLRDDSVRRVGSTASAPMLVRVRIGPPEGLTRTETKVRMSVSLRWWSGSSPEQRSSERVSAMAPTDVLPDARVNKNLEGTGFRARVQKFGGFLAGMIMPNIGAFIAW